MTQLTKSDAAVIYCGTPESISVRIRTRHIDEDDYGAGVIVITVYARGHRRRHLWGQPFTNSCKNQILPRISQFSRSAQADCPFWRRSVKVTGILFATAHHHETDDAQGAPGRVGTWFAPAVIQPNNFVYKSLSSWSFNIAIGCSHACQFCYVPSAATIKQGQNLSRYGVKDPDLEWGQYVLLRPWDEKKFLASLRSAERVPASELNRDGNRAVMYCTTTDPYQVIHHPEPIEQKKLAQHALRLVRRSLELIRDESTLNVRILTRSPMARLDFDLFNTFGKRLVFGMSLPTLRNDLAKVYEPKAPAPTQRLATLKKAKEAGLHVYVAVAPTYPECDEADLAVTLRAIAELDPLTVFHEPINIRAENATKIAEASRTSGIRLKTEVFASQAAWSSYALQSLKSVWRIAREVGISDRLHLWPDKILGSRSIINSMPDPEAYEKWLRTRWARISEWPR